MHFGVYLLIIALVLITRSISWPRSFCKSAGRAKLDDPCPAAEHPPKAHGDPI
jgi:hypothetical protein